jgi:hypothetical protein
VCTILSSKGSTVLSILQEEKGTKQIKEDKVKEQRKIQQAANAFIKERKRLEKERRDAASQLAKELLAEVPASLEIPLVQPNSTTTKAKLTAPTMRKSKSKPKLLEKPSQFNSKASESFQSCL